MADTLNPTRTALTFTSSPYAFPGTPAQVQSNMDSHHFYWEDEGDTRCGHCDCRPSMVSATWPCGTHVPRGEGIGYMEPAPVETMAIRGWGYTIGSAVFSGHRTMASALRALTEWRAKFDQAGAVASDMVHRGELRADVTFVGWVTVEDALGYYQGMRFVQDAEGYLLHLW